MRITTGFIAAAMLFVTSASHAEIPNDLHVQSDRFDMADNLEASLAQFNYRYVRWLHDEGYPIPTIILHMVSQGMSINDVVFLLTSLDPANAKAVYTMAMELLPSLPATACQSDDDLSDRYFTTYTLQELGPEPTIIKVAERFFDKNARLAPFPAWKSTLSSHMQANIDELILLSKREPQGSSPQQQQQNAWWYRTSTLPIDGKLPLFISLYPYGKQIVVDADTELLQKLKDSGTIKVPVVFVYNGQYYIPTSDVEFSDQELAGPLQPVTELLNSASSQYIDNKDGDITASEVMYRYFTTRARLTPPREWHDADYHLAVTTRELRSLFTLPAKESVSKTEWETIKLELQEKGFSKPVIITVFGDSTGYWIDEPTSVAVAEELGIERVPTLFLFHETGRYSCGLPSACGDGVCNAALAAGASPDTCQKPRQRAAPELRVPEVKEATPESPEATPEVAPETPPEPPISLPVSPTYSPQRGPASLN